MAGVHQQWLCKQGHKEQSRNNQSVENLNAYSLA